ncbi:hypothetical protein NM688_g2671 [Phlebia brevispora]|uniref:Uncharacterized protein n=1 Tax=Phlebia brevispora TaxID=194682 RepID=A0ACC1T857_9APHY|nr:hypothetical protein NM688_g2671 [Phlebia brevispora]
MSLLGAYHSARRFDAICAWALPPDVSSIRTITNDPLQSTLRTVRRQITPSRARRKPEVEHPVSPDAELTSVVDTPPKESLQDDFLGGPLVVASDLVQGLFAFLLCKLGARSFEVTHISHVGNPLRNTFSLLRFTLYYPCADSEDQQDDITGMRDAALNLHTEDMWFAYQLVSDAHAS